ncbi:putative lipoprotein YiaD [Bacteroidaceae bacterium]|uniref:OmpA family protein n=1 Tax=Prevotella sp. MGM2 TaxID=2033406 RepID=UPI000CEA1AF5|nr:OmpA family protein [Prevotella sp. MGM2]GFI35127.1 putative lipoprotein YiaD [Bacteroidaceae bacterium]
MKTMKFSTGILCIAMLLSACSMSNTAKGGLIGGGSGGALGALIGQLAGGGKGAAIGAAIGTAVGAGTGTLIGHKMDKAKKAAEAANAETEVITDENGNAAAVKATFPSGILFSLSSSTLSAQAQSNLKTFVTNLDTDLDLSIYGFTDNTPFKGVSAAQSQEKNKVLSLQRAQTVSNFLKSSGLAASRIREVTGLGETNPVADNSTAAGKEQNRRVEIYIFPSEALIKQAQQQAQ